jgi:hypothetical protein
MNLCDAIEHVLRLARQAATTTEDKEACDQVEDFAVNELGDE